MWSIKLLLCLLIRTIWALMTIFKTGKAPNLGHVWGLSKTLWWPGFSRWQRLRIKFGWRPLRLLPRLISLLIHWPIIESRFPLELPGRISVRSSSASHPTPLGSVRVVRPERSEQTFLELFPFSPLKTSSLYFT